MMEVTVRMTCRDAEGVAKRDELRFRESALPNHVGDCSCIDASVIGTVHFVNVGGAKKCLHHLAQQEHFRERQDMTGLRAN